MVQCETANWFKVTLRGSHQLEYLCLMATLECGSERELSDFTWSQFEDKPKQDCKISVFCPMIQTFFALP